MEDDAVTIARDITRGGLPHGMHKILTLLHPFLALVFLHGVQDPPIYHRNLTAHSVLLVHGGTSAKLADAGFEPFLFEYFWWLTMCLGLSTTMQVALASSPAAARVTEKDALHWALCAPPEVRSYCVLACL
jgi:serine/threonine protein kinase